MSTFLIKRLLPAVLFLFILLLLTLRGQAQGQEHARDSISRTTHITLLKYHFLIAGEWYKIQKFRLPSEEHTNADSLFLKCIADYKKIYSATPQQDRPAYFSDSFYDAVIPVVQYFRSPATTGLLFKDQATLHPKAPAPDPKHHEEEHPEDHKEN